MVAKLLRKVFGSRNDRQVKKYRKIVNRINNLEADFEALSDEQLGAKTIEFRERLSREPVWKTYCPRHLPLYEKPVNAHWVCVISMCK